VIEWIGSSCMKEVLVAICAGAAGQDLVPLPVHHSSKGGGWTGAVV